MPFIRTILLVALLASTQSAQAGLFDKVTGIFLDNDTEVKVPLDSLNDQLINKSRNPNKWLQPSVGYKFQFMNYPGDPSRYLRRERLDLRLDIPRQLNGTISILAGPRVSAEFIRPFAKGEKVCR